MSKSLATTNKLRNFINKLHGYWRWRPVDKSISKLFLFLKNAVITFCTLLILDLIFPINTKVAYAPIVTAKSKEPLYAFLTEDQQWRFYAGLEEITPELRTAIVYKEDKYFYMHPGINPVAVVRAFANNMLSRKRTSGASTITMQVARLLNPKKRTYANKIVEILRAFQLEWHYSKEEILQLYLNLVPYGSNIQGVKAAALIYFDKSPDQLSLAEITALSIIPNRPNSLVLGKDNDYIVQQRNTWLHHFERARIFEKQTILDALNEPLQAVRLSPPRLAPQFALRLRRYYPTLHEIQSTINLQLQQKLESIVSTYSKGLWEKDIYNAAAIVIDNRNMQTVAYIGSSDFFDRNHHGQVDGVKAVRSPGSTLKPLLYGVGFDHGLATPKFATNDVPIAFKDYAPENYDLDYRGKITIEEALKLSLNIPAVNMLNQIGVPNFVTLLNQAGFSAIWKDRKKMGLSLILGGCGVRLEELAALYASFANQGRYRPLRWIEHTGQDSATILLSPEASYMVTEILQGLQRPDLPSGASLAINLPKIAWKTGTSYGRRDAWSVGYNKNYTIAVWLGNFSGKGAPSINGAQIATPLLFQLFNAVDKEGVKHFNSAPSQLQQRLVCTESGLPPNECCTQQIVDYFIPGISPNGLCQHIKEYEVDPQEKFSYCTACLPNEGFITKKYLNLAPELASFYHLRNIKTSSAPPHNTDCQRSFHGIAPRINTLTHGGTYLITDPDKQKLQLSCAAASDVQKVYWYINDKYLGSCKKHESILFSPDLRKTKISCTDDKGRTTHIYINIKFI
jgi:penicillin-binding protein 1C